MSIVVGVLSLLLTIAFVGAGGARLAGAKPMRAYSEHLGLSAGVSRAIGALELAAAAGLIAGLWVRPAGLAASIGLVFLLVATVARHVRAGDPPALAAPPAALGVLAVANAVLLGLV
ncbi:DoxX protein [Saccharomonospora marina XMU15]|uniref:DoxX protein n=1 Tax=Saccharomonospora marina XMU15 TaxID=882083 RepID=H5XA45_9PSEU|nr:DoxX family protein [Saccharomonospora marina]EHR53705.1 DoxX protein [Saccharomonospora marina XMU15]